MPLMPHWPRFFGPHRDITDSNERTRNILDLFGNLQNDLQNVIHITGTNGKGSTASYIAAILQDAGCKVGKYTSPHIHNCNERINVSGVDISDIDFYEITEEIRVMCEKHRIEPTIFEATTIAYILHAARVGCEFNVVEVGMGGLNDQTNVFDQNQPLVSIITPISLDHVKFLGGTEVEIAMQKSFIIKSGSICVCAPQMDSVKGVINKRCEDIGASVYHFDEDFFCSEIEGDDEHWLFEGRRNKDSDVLDVRMILPKPSLIGEHQIVNAAVATMCVILL